jgi:hypothetical protein
MLCRRFCFFVKRKHHPLHQTTIAKKTIMKWWIGLCKDALRIFLDYDQFQIIRENQLYVKKVLCIRSSSLGTGLATTWVDLWCFVLKDRKWQQSPWWLKE